MRQTPFGLIRSEPKRTTTMAAPGCGGGWLSDEKICHHGDNLQRNIWWPVPDYTSRPRVDSFMVGSCVCEWVCRCFIPPNGKPRKGIARIQAHSIARGQCERWYEFDIPCSTSHRPSHPPKNVVTFVESPRETAVLCSAVTFIPALQRNGCNLC